MSMFYKLQAGGWVSRSLQGVHGMAWQLRCHTCAHTLKPHWLLPASARAGDLRLGTVGGGCPGR